MANQPVPLICCFLALLEVLRLTSVSKATLYRWIDCGLFPAPVKIGPRRVAWRSNEVADWIAAPNRFGSAQMQQHKSEQEK